MPRVRTCDPDQPQNPPVPEFENSRPQILPQNQFFPRPGCAGKYAGAPDQLSQLAPIFPLWGSARGRGRRHRRPGASHGTRRTDADVIRSPSRERCQSVRTLRDDWYDGTWSLLVCSRSVGGFLDLASGSTRRVSTETAATMPRAAPPLQSLSTLQTTCCLANNVIGCCWRHVVADPPLGFSEPDYWYAKPPRRGAYTRFPPPGAPPARRTRRG